MQHLHEPICPGSDTTLHKWVMGRVARKVSGNMSRSDFEGWVQDAADAFPRPNNCPRTWYMYKRIVGVRNLHDFVWHFCPCGLYRYPRIAATPAAYREHSDDSCPLCHVNRFVKDMQGRLAPANWIFYLGVEVAIRDFLFANPDFVALRKQERPTGVDTFWGSPEAARIDAALGGMLFHEDNGAYTLFSDFFEAYKHKVHSTGVMLLRSLNINPENAGRLDMAVTIMIVRGPKAPAVAAAFTDLVARDFKRCMERGIVVGSGGSAFLHRPVLVGMDADGPAAQWSGEFIKANNAINGCFKCKLNGTSVSIAITFKQSCCAMGCQYACPAAEF